MYDLLTEVKCFLKRNELFQMENELLLEDDSISVTANLIFRCNIFSE